MATPTHLKKISLDRLCIGMHIIELDIPWIESPFMRHHKTIKATKEIDALRKAGVKKLIIDTNKGTGLSEPVVESPKQPKPKDKKDQAPEPSKRLEKTSLNNEMQAAQAIRGKVKKAVENLHEAVGKRLPIEEAELTPLIDQTLESLERNNQALMSLVHLSRAAQKVADHTFSVFCLSLNIARKLNLSAEDQHDLGLAALLHETGWTQLPLNLMGKRTKYTELERKLVNKHPELAVSLLKDMDFNETVLTAIKQHHEAGDGSGYPEGLKNDALHEISRVLIIADAYDESINQLNDRPGMMPTNALRDLFIQSDKGIFEQKIVASFIDVLGIYPVSSAVKLSSSEKAVVLEVTPGKHLLPVVEVHYDAKGKVLPSPFVQDLSSLSGNSAKTIESILDPNNPDDDPSRRLYLDL
ncbi:MAG: putative nucleotidyltransferase with HDIG domain [Flavobacteriales bacterium]|jgi:putative nucleotidyltransferase with HDIG domain